MRKLLFTFTAVFATAPLLAQSPIRFQNHYLGESAMDFLEDEPAISQRLEECHDIDAHPESWLRKVNPGIADRLNDPSRHKEDGPATDRQLMDYFLKDARQARGCDALHNIFDLHGKGDLQRRPADSPPNAGTSMQWFFTGGSLQRMHLVFEKTSFDQVKTDMFSKLGSAPVESNEPYQNSFGANWSNQVAYWLTPMIHAVLVQVNNPADSYLKLDIETRAALEMKLQQEQAKPNSLD